MRTPPFPSARLRRRDIVVAAGGALVLVAAPVVHAQQRGMNTTQDWFTVIKRQHQQIEHAFELLLRARGSGRELQLRSLDQILKGHQFGEENAIYPAMARAGLTEGADRLYAEEAHAKIELARLELASPDRGSDWNDTARKLQQLVLEHAHKDEEQQWYPQLKDHLQPDEDHKLGPLFAREFSRVLPIRS